MVNNKRLFRQIRYAFQGRYRFALPGIFEQPSAKAAHAPAT